MWRRLPCLLVVLVSCHTDPVRPVPAATRATVVLRKRAPIPAARCRLHTVADVKTRLKRLRRPVDVVTLRDARRMPVNAYVAELNRHQRALCAHGWTMAELAGKRVVLESPATPPPSPEPPPLTGPLASATPSPQTFLLPDKPLVHVTFRRAHALVNRPADAVLTDEHQLTLYFLGFDIPIATLRASATLPASLRADSPRLAQGASLTALGKPYAVSPPAVVDGSLEQQLTVPCEPFMCTVEVGVTPALTASATAVAEATHGDTHSVLDASLGLRLEASIGFLIVSAGLAVEENLGAVHIESRTAVAMTPQPSAGAWRTTRQELTRSTAATATTGGGHLDFELEVDYLFGDYTYTWRIVKWEGSERALWTEPTPPIVIERPAACPGREGFAQCGTTTAGAPVCVDLARDVAHCGGCGVACPGDRICKAGACINPPPPCEPVSCGGRECCDQCPTGECSRCAPPGGACQ